MADDSLLAPAYAEGYEHFAGSHDRTLDDKGRLVLPAGAWRERFQGQARLTIWSAGRLALWTVRSWGETCARLDLWSRKGDTGPHTLRTFRASTREVAIDAQGRFPLPADLRDRLELSGPGATVTIEGQGDHLELLPASGSVLLTLDELQAELDRFA